VRPVRRDSSNENYGENQTTAEQSSRDNEGRRPAAIGRAIDSFTCLGTWKLSWHGALPPHLKEQATIYVLNPAKGFESHGGDQCFHAFVTRTGDDAMRGAWP